MRWKINSTKNVLPNKVIITAMTTSNISAYELLLLTVKFLISQSILNKLKSQFSIFMDLV